MYLILVTSFCEKCLCQYQTGIILCLLLTPKQQLCPAQKTGHVQVPCEAYMHMKIHQLSLFNMGHCCNGYRNIDFPCPFCVGHNDSDLEHTYDYIQLSYGDKNTALDIIKGWMNLYRLQPKSKFQLEMFSKVTTHQQSKNHCIFLILTCIFKCESLFIDSRTNQLELMFIPQEATQH